MISISIVSHGHGSMVGGLIEVLLGYPEISEIIVTKNIPEDLVLTPSRRITIVDNNKPKGFGANHNQAFHMAKQNYFCVLNPDISLPANPFPELIYAIMCHKAGLVVPLVLSPSGKIDDSLRHFPTPSNLIRRALFNSENKYDLNIKSKPFSPDWAAGMFMLFNRDAFSKVNGFDENFHLYYEDVDICTRLWSAGFKIVACPNISVVHHAQRTSHRNLKFAIWHLNSMFRYLTKHYKNLPSVSKLLE